MLLFINQKVGVGPTWLVNTQVEQDKHWSQLSSIQTCFQEVPSVCRTGKTLVSLCPPAPEGVRGTDAEGP